MASLEARVIEVPIDNSNDVLEIDCSQLPSHAAEICDILENEGSALRFYQLFALEYYKQGHIEEAVVALKRGMANAKANDQTAKVPLLNLLASIYVQKAKSTSVVGGDRDIMLKMATALLTEAERIDRTEPNTHLIAGMLDLAKRQPDAALRHFDAALRAAPRSVAALLGRARVLFSKHRYQHALEAYQQVLVLRPAGSGSSSRPDPRIGIGLCLHKLGHADDARRALLRAAEVDPAAAAPHILLATMDLNAVKRLLDPRITDAAAAGTPPARGAGLMGGGELLRRAMAQLQAAYERQPASAATLIRLADRLFFQAKYDAARGLAERALAAADTMALQAEAHYQAARAHHAARRFDLAYDAYQRCVAINDRHHLARYGLGQMQLHRTDMSSAEATFQRVLDAHPRCVEVLRALGYLHARLPNTKAKALEYYEREMHVLAEDANPSEAAAPPCFTDANLFLEAGLLYEASSARRARAAYAMAADILQRGGGGGDACRLLPELWNNLGALGQLAGADDAAVFADYDCAARKCTAALADARARLAELRRGGGVAAAAAHGSSAAAAGASGAAAAAGAAGARGAAAGEVQRLESTRATLSYNVARFYERRGMWARAEALYARLLADVPTYVDATLRLAHVAFFVRADADRALALVAQAIDVDSKRAAAWLLRGNIELHRQHVQDARRAFEHVLKDIAKHDVYALCSLGNFYLAAGRSEHARGSSDASDPAAAKRASDLSAQSYKRALEFFDKCLQLDERCAAAAHGTAIALAERGCAHEARQVFQDVRDAATAGLGPPTLCSTASDLVFKGAAAATARHSLPTPPPPPVPQASGADGCDVLLWSGINAAHALVDTGNYRQAVLAYEASLRRLQDSSPSSSSSARADEAADDSTSPAALSRFVVSALEAPKHGAAETEPPPLPPSPPPATTRVTEVARAERKRVERDLRLYLVRALYIQAKAAKDIDIMRTALDHMRSLCTDECISLPPATTTTTASVEETDEVVEMTTEEESTNKKQAVRLSPDDCLLLFDLALIEQSVAQLVSEQPESQRTLQDLSLASENIAHSTAAFTFLASWGKTLQKKRQKLNFSPKLATERAGYSRSLVSKLERKHEEQAQFERQRQEHVEQWRKHQEEDELRKRMEVEAADQQQRELEAKLLKDAEERNAALRREQQQQIADSDQPPLSQPPTGKSKKNKSRDDFVSDDLLLAAASDDSHDLLSRARKTKKNLPARRNAAAATGEPRGRVRTKPEGGHTDEDPDEPVVRKRRNVDDEDGDMDDYDEQEEESVPRTTTTGSTSKHKSKAIITDSDDSSDN